MTVVVSVLRAFGAATLGDLYATFQDSLVVPKLRAPIIQ